MASLAWLVPKGLILRDEFEWELDCRYGLGQGRVEESWTGLDWTGLKTVNFNV